MRSGWLGSLLVRWIRESLDDRELQRDISATWDQFPDWPIVTAERARWLRSMPYPTYLETPEWQLRAKQIKVSANMRCAACGGNSRLQVHHLTYDRRGYERPADLQVLCRECHRLVHQDRVR